MVDSLGSWFYVGGVGEEVFFGDFFCFILGFRVVRVVLDFELEVEEEMERVEGRVREWGRFYFCFFWIYTYLGEG